MGYVEWQVNGSPTARVGASALGPDQDGTTGSGVGQRLIPVEPMASIPPFVKKTLVSKLML